MRTTFVMLPPSSLWSNPDLIRPRADTRIFVYASKAVSNSLSNLFQAYWFMDFVFYWKQKVCLILSYIYLPEIKKEKELPVVLSKAEVWSMLKQLLKHRILIGLLYSCGLLCLEIRSIRFRKSVQLVSMLYSKMFLLWKPNILPLPFRE